MLLFERFDREDDFFFIGSNVEFIAVVWEEKCSSGNRDPVPEFPFRKVYFPDFFNRHTASILPIENIDPVIVDVEVRIFRNGIADVHHLTIKKRCILHFWTVKVSQFLHKTRYKIVSGISDLTVAIL